MKAGDDKVGERILIPYLLNKSITKIDYIIVSHFDSDHVGGIITVIEKLNVDTVIISKQDKICENYERFVQVVNKRKVKIVFAKMGDRLKVENDLYFDFLWPSGEHVINDNILNNNSLVCNMHYNGFSVLFTGDIEKIAEEQILQSYKENYSKLRATVLKVGHHGSKTSSIQQFIERVNPKYALIGVGVDNKFGHPNNEIISRLKNMRN